MITYRALTVVDERSTERLYRPLWFFYRQPLQVSEERRWRAQPHPVAYPVFQDFLMACSLMTS